MDVQPSLFDAKPAKAKAGRKSLAERFADHHAARPEQYEEFKAIADRLRRQGVKRYSADGIGHEMRRRFAIRGKAGDEYSVNNSYMSRYARLLIAEDGWFANFFELRELKS